MCLGEQKLHSPSFLLSLELLQTLMHCSNQLQRCSAQLSHPAAADGWNPRAQGRRGAAQEGTCSSGPPHSQASRWGSCCLQGGEKHQLHTPAMGTSILTCEHHGTALTATVTARGSYLSSSLSFSSCAESKTPLGWVPS